MPSLLINSNLCASINKQYLAIFQLFSSSSYFDVSGSWSLRFVKLFLNWTPPILMKCETQGALKYHKRLNTEDWRLLNCQKEQMFQTAIASWINGNSRRSQAISIRLLFIIANNSWSQSRQVFIRKFCLWILILNSKRNTSSRFSRASFDEKQRVTKGLLG